MTVSSNYHIEFNPSDAGIYDMIKRIAQTHIGVNHNIYKKKGLHIPSELATRIADKSERNLCRAILMLEACKVQQYLFTVNHEAPEIDWQVFIRETANQIVQEQSPQKLEAVRERLYELLSQGVLSDIIFRGLVENLVKNCDMSLKTQTLNFAGTYEQRMQQGSKHIFHLEAFVSSWRSLWRCTKNPEPGLRDGLRRLLD